MFANVVLLIAIIAIAMASEINHLPGSEEISINFKHYSGYLHVSPNHYLHYWFVESQSDLRIDPLIFWFNGGPGCSSLEGILQEMGPYIVNDDGMTLLSNPFTWNKMTSVVYIESPAGVGFSYSTDGSIATDDDQTSLENYEAIKGFFNQFPTLRNNPTYIMGESYGGVYVPTLTARIIDNMDQFKINLQGMAIGNGYLSARLNVDTLVQFAYYHGIVSEKVWHALEEQCCSKCVDTCHLTQLNDTCATLVENIFNFVWTGGLNVYDIYRDCILHKDISINRLTAAIRGLTPNSMKLLVNKTEILNKIYRANERNMDVPCLADGNLIYYLNQEVVRDALYIPEHVPHWDVCSDSVSKNYRQQYDSMDKFVKKIHEANVRILLYYGDTDMACNFLLGQQFVANLNLKRTTNKAPWKFREQIAGFKTIYDHNLTFLTIKGTGHMAPEWKAPQMQYVIEKFLLNQPI